MSAQSSASELTDPSVFVNGRPRPTIMEDMRARIDRGRIDAERQEAIQVSSSRPMMLNLPTHIQQAMCDIAIDRAVKLQG